MTRFDADTPTDRRKLFADAVTAHRTRGSAFLTIEAAPPESPAFDPDDGDEAEEDDETAVGDETAASDDVEGDEEEDVPPWLQFAEKTFNLDVSDEELERVKSLVDEFPEFRIDELDSPDTAEGTNVKITARSDANRLADFADRVFREVYDREEGYRAWVVAV